VGPQTTSSRKFGLARNSEGSKRLTNAVRAESDPRGGAGRPSPVGGPGYNVAVAEPRDEFPNHFVGDLVPTERGWVVVPPTSCPDGHNYSDGGWKVAAVWCACNDRHMEWRCHCGANPTHRSRDRNADSATEAQCR
jgi:hypothetical protein